MKLDLISNRHDFNRFSVIQDDEQVIMKGCVQWNPS